MKIANLSLGPDSSGGELSHLAYLVGLQPLMTVLNSLARLTRPTVSVTGVII